MADKQTIELLKEAARLRTAAKAEMEKITKELLKQGNISEAQARVEAKKQEGYKKIVEQLKEINSQVQEQRTAQKEAIGSLMQQEQRLKSFSGLQQSIVGFERKKIELLAQQGSMHQNQKDAFGRISDLNQELLGLSAEDIVSRGEISRQIEAEITALDEKGKRQNGLGAGSRELLAVMKKEYAVASNISNLTQDQQKQLEAQLSTYDSIKKSIGGVLDTAAALTSTLGAAVGGLLIGVGMVVDKFGQVNRELGQSFVQGLNSSTASATALGFIFDDTAGTVRELASEFGGVDAATLSTQTNIGLMATNMGISNKEAVGLTASFARMNGGSTDIAADMVKTTQEFASQNGIIPAALMQDLAGATEQFALFGKDGGKNILEAAGYAQKLGVNMNTISGIADNLLDFESSITKELELGAMLGRNINLDRARALAFEGDIKGATEETLRALGGIESFNRMDYFQKKQTADLLGVSVAELQKMADNQNKAATMGDAVNAKFSKMGELINGGLNKYLGTGLKGLGGMITMTGQLGTGFSAMGTSIGGIVKGTGQVLKNILQMTAGSVLKGLKVVGGALSNSKLGKAVGGVKDKLMSGVADKFSGGGATSPKGSGMPGKGIMEGMSKINMNAVLKGAAAMVIVAGAVFVFGKAVQEFMKVSWEAVGMAVVSMLALVGAVALLGAIMMSGVGAVAILAGAAAMLVIAASVLVLGHALQAIGTGFEMMASGIGTLMPQLMSVATTISGLVLLIPAIGLLSLSLMGLSASLMALGVAGIVAAPGLMALGAVGAITQGLNSLFGGGEEEEAGDGGGEDKSQLLIDEIKGLRSDLLSGKIGVYMDGEKVTSRVSAAVERVGGNSYAMS